MDELKYYNTREEYEEALSIEYLSFPTVAYIKSEEEVEYVPHNLVRNYLTLEAIDDCDFVFNMGSYLDPACFSYIEYSLDNGDTWIRTDNNSNSIAYTATVPTVQAGSHVLVRGNGKSCCYRKTNYSPSESYALQIYSTSGRYNVSGNIMSLLYGSDFLGKTSLYTTTIGQDSFHFLFSYYNNSDKLISAKDLYLPATTLSDHCYVEMFKGCSSLTNAPAVLPATTLANECYYSMFEGCSSLVKAPKLPATTLVERCYYQMFKGCTSLTEASELPATTLVNGCYYSMFERCTSLVNAPELPATTLATQCYYQMFYNCFSLTGTLNLPATTFANNCYFKMFYGTGILPGCTNIDFSSPNVVASGALAGLFAGTKITDEDLWDILPIDNNDKYCLPVTTLTTTGCYQYMFQDCTSLSTAPELPATTLVSNCYYSMFYGCTSLTTVPELPATTLASYCYYSMFYKCSSLITAPELPATTLATRCYESMFYGCSSLQTAPELPATTLVNNCYRQMFQNCINLNYIKAMFTTTPSSSYTSSWMSGVAETGIFVKNSSATWNVFSSDGIPEGWGVIWPTVDQYNYFTTEAVDNCIFTFTIPVDISSEELDYVEYSLDNGQTWQKTNNVEEQEVVVTTSTIQAGGKVLWRALGYHLGNDNDGSNMSSSGRYRVSGNPMSLTACNTTLASEWTFRGLFKNSVNLISAENLILFSLNLTEGCYAEMFSGCTGLTATPELPARDLVENCYADLFKNCSSVDYIKALFTTTPSDTYTARWVSGVANSGNFIKSCAATWSVSGDNGIPSGWISKTDAEIVSDEYLNKYLTFEAIEAGTFTLTVPTTVTNAEMSSISYSLDNGNTWTTTQIDSTAQTITTPTVPIGGKVLWKGSGTKLATALDQDKRSSFSATGNFSASGNIMSLLFGDNFNNQLTLTGTYSFAHLFSSNTKLISSKNLVLPATTIATYSYSNMFLGCSNMTDSLILLPATKAPLNCYNSMFNSCSSMVNGPKLVAATAHTGSSALNSMFKNCSSLIQAPEIPSTSLGQHCYRNMFQSCTALKVPPKLPSTASGTYCYRNMFGYCTSLVDCPKINLTTVPAEGCMEMFRGCTKLKNIPTMSLKSGGNNAFESMFQGCVSLTDGPQNLTLTVHGGSEVCEYMFYGCQNLTEIPNITFSSSSVGNSSCGNMFSDCSNITTSPVLTATTLGSYCYRSMFSNCSKLNRITMLATDIPSNNCISGWINNVAPTGTFIKSADANWSENDSTIVPPGWTVETYSPS